MFTNFKKSFIFAILLSLTSFSSYAAHTGWYGGISLGNGDIDYPGYDDADTFSLFFGQNYSDRFAMEFAITDLGEYKVTGAPFAYLDVGGLEVTAVGKLPLSNNARLYGKAG